MGLFTDEQMIEILKVKARLEAYRNKCQPYPPEGLVSQPQEQVIVHRHYNMSKQDYDLLQQTARRVDYLEKKLAEKEKPKAQGKFGYRGIK